MITAPLEWVDMFMQRKNVTNTAWCAAVISDESPAHHSILLTLASHEQAGIDMPLQNTVALILQPYAVCLL